MEQCCRVTFDRLRLLELALTLAPSSGNKNINFHNKKPHIRRVEFDIRHEKFDFNIFMINHNC